MRRKIVSIGLATTLFAVSPAMALQIWMPRTELCAVADRVVIGEVTSGETLWGEGDEGGIYRRMWIAAERNLRGGGADTVELILPGGEIDGFVDRVEHVPDLEIDKRYLLFLKVSEHGSWRISGGDLGASLVAPPEGGEGETFLQALASVGRCDEA